MKRVLLILALAAISIMTYAQAPIKFMGIPVDGSKTQMIQKLQGKGFTKVQGYDCLKGQFNGRNVNVFIQTNKNKVCRIMVAQTDLTDIAGVKTDFNILCSQFENNPKYIDLISNQSIPEGTDILYEMSIHNKQFDAMYYQKPAEIDTVKMQQEMDSLIYNYIAEHNLNIHNLSDEQKETMSNEIVQKVMYDTYSKRPVWFRICELNGEYYITMYYDNEFNRSHGEDL